MDLKGLQKNREDCLGVIVVDQVRGDCRVVQGGGGGEREEWKVLIVICKIKSKEIVDEQEKGCEGEGRVRS